jgi:hypothetical protein
MTEEEMDVSRLIDPAAFERWVLPHDTPVDERARIEERQIVAKVRAGAVLARLKEMGWTPPALTRGDAPQEDLRRPPPDAPGG